MRTSLLITIGLIGLFLVIFNAIFLLVILSIRRKMSRAGTWPSTKGIIMTSSLESHSSNEGRYTDYPVVRYSYQVGEQAFQGSRIALGPEVGGTTAQQVIERYPAGSSVNVFYDPLNPADALLENSVPAQRGMWIILGIFDFILCVGIPLMWWALSQQ